MRPVLFHIGSLPVYSYSAFVVLAYFACLGYGWLEAKRLNQDPIHVIDLSLWIFLSGIAGSMIFFRIVYFERFIADPIEILKIWKGGLVFYGGLIATVLTGLVYMKRNRLPLGLWFDLCAPTAMLCLAVGRVGCFLNGCCYGKFAPELFCAVTYPVSHAALGLARYPVHPTPLYESAGVILIFIFLVWLSRAKHVPGQVFWSMTLAYSILRFNIEFFRADPRGMVPGIGLSTSQAISMVAAPASIFILIWLGRRAAGLKNQEEGREVEAGEDDSA